MHTILSLNVIYEAKNPVKMPIQAFQIILPTSVKWSR